MANGAGVFSEAGAAINLAAKRCPSSLLQPLARVFQADASTPDDPARGKRTAQLKRQFENAFLYIRELGDEQAERFGRGLNYLFNDGSNDLARSGTVRFASGSTLSRK
jgi:hypothetical protein